MKTIITFTIAFLCILNMALAQKKTLKYGVVAQAGLLNGDAGEDLSLQVINGVTMQKWFAGIGAGIDYYRNRSAPVFLDIRRDLTSKKNTPFVYVDGGVNFSWLTTAEKNAKGLPREYRSGGYYDVGVGWKLKGKNNRGFLASVGYNYKQMKETGSELQWFIVSTVPTYTPEYYNNQYKRFVVKIGFQL